MMTSNHGIRDAIVDAAIELAESSSWEAVRLFDVAVKMKISLDDIRFHFREKEELVDAWFDRADSAMLKLSENADFLVMPHQERLNDLIMAWLNTLSVHRNVTRQMIGAKLEPGHIHIQIPAVMRVSRTVQWVREAAQRDATYVRRALEETVLTTIYLAAFVYWMNDVSNDSQNTREFLRHKLQLAETLDRALYGFQQESTESSPSHVETEVIGPNR